MTGDPGALVRKEGYAVVPADAVDDHYAGTDVPGEFRRLTEALGADQLAATLIRVPPHSDFEQDTGHYHAEIEELYRELFADTGGVPVPGPRARCIRTEASQRPCL